VTLTELRGIKERNYMGTDYMENTKDVDYCLLQKKLGHSFTDISYLEQALTRFAKVHEDKQLEYGNEIKGHKDDIIGHQDEYVTLGDAVLKLIITEELIERGFVTKDEITKKRQTIENRKTLSRIGIKLTIPHYIFTTLGEEKNRIRDNYNVIGETVEAVVGAITLDMKGFEKSIKNTIIPWFNNISCELCNKKYNPFDPVEDCEHIMKK